MNGKISAEKPNDRPTIRKGVLQWMLVNLVFLLALGTSMFLAAGRLDWDLGWIFLGGLTAGQTAMTLLLLPTNPALLGERSWMRKGSKPWDTLIVSLGDAGWLVLGVVAGLDARFHGSPRLPIEVPVIGFGLLGLGYLVFLWAITSNRFFSSFVRIQTDRGHTVETSGPYRYVRHPGYAGALLVYSASPLALASLWAAIPALLMVCLFLYRTVREDRTLQVELDGYAAYAQRVRYRLLPGVW